MMVGQAFKIGVFGSAGGYDVKNQMLSAAIIGENIAESGNIVCTGACYGLPYEAATSANSVGGIVLGFSPFVSSLEHAKSEMPGLPHVLVFTGMGLKGRNLICTRTCDAGIFIAGRWGTMNEFTLMCDEGEGKVIGLLKNSGGFVDSLIIPGLDETDKQSKATIIIDDDPAELVRRVVNELSKQ